MFGGNGDDVIAGGAGDDTLTGGDGQDTFVFDAADAATSTDLITDFIVTEDVFQLSRAVAGNTFVDFDETETRP